MQDTRVTHHGASAGDDKCRDVDVHSVIGGMTAPPKAIARLAAARTGLPVPIANPISSTATVLMRDGSGVAVPVMAYEHPAAQRVHVGIFNASINQARARPRAVLRSLTSPVAINFFANAAPNMPIDVIVRWRDVKPDRLDHMVRAGVVFLNAADMHTHYPKMFPSENAAAKARARAGDIWPRLRERFGRFGRPSVRVHFKPPGQGMQLRWLVCFADKVDEVRAMVEAKAGELVHWKSEPFEPGRREVMAIPVLVPNTPMAMPSTEIPRDVGHRPPNHSARPPPDG